ncbi:hypothetical protein [Thalassotalea sediminis]|uniref:hypothetical protein n=1 Tax=Thalassotalea sediminis TaxID=1759089 RepID=UPI0025732CA3|nr:hypothetical protein [Thalassotalea sediminis]
MTVFKWVSLILMTLCSACSSTSKQVSYTEKRAIVSDHMLMMSLLDRPVTEDQKIMLAFANYQEQMQHTLKTPAFVRPISVIGNSAESSQSLMPNYYQTLIAKDINAARISGPE